MDFDFYNPSSTNTSDTSIQESPSPKIEDSSIPEVREVLPVYKRYSRLGVIVWFVKRNFFSLFSRILLVALFIWLFFCGGFSKGIDLFIRSLNRLASKQSSVPVQPSETSSDVILDDSVQTTSDSDSSVTSVVSPSLPEDTSKPQKVTIVAMMTDSVYLSNGDIIKVGDIINANSPILNSQNENPVSVVSINYRHCCVLFSDGFVLRMFHN